VVARADWPTSTFTYMPGVIQRPTENNKYDPKTKTLTLYYNNLPDGSIQTDILTYMGDDDVYGQEYTQWTWPNSMSAKDPHAVQNWEHVRSSGYKWWLPIDE
jgi:hypothetical protein